MTVDVETLRRLAMALPHVDDRSGEGRLAFEVAGKGIAWTYLVRAAPKKPRLPQIGVLAVRCEMARKELLIEAAPDRFFDDDHYRGFPAVLVRLDQVDADELASLLRDAWRIQAPKTMRAELP
jgi:hypothetical protein